MPTCQAMSFALPFTAPLRAPRFGDEPFQLLQLVGAGVPGPQHGQDQLIKGAVEDLVEEAPRDLLAAVFGEVDEGAALGAVADEALLLHDAQERLHGVEV